MSQINPNLYIKPYGAVDRSDGWYVERATNDLVAFVDGAEVSRITSGGSETITLAEGYIFVGNSSSVATAVNAKTSGQILVGNGTTLASVAVSGDATLASTGALTVTDVTVGSDAAGDVLYKSSATAMTRLAKGTAGQVMLMNAGATAPSWASMSGDATIAATGALTLSNEQRFHSATVSLTKANIVGTDAGDIGHADGFQLVAAVADHIIFPVVVVINYTFDTAAYTDGGNLTAGYKDGVAVTGLLSAAETFGLGASGIFSLRAKCAPLLAGKALVLRSAAGYTDPGTAAGTASITTYYNLFDV